MHKIAHKPGKSTHKDDENRIIVQPTPANGWETLKPHLWFEYVETPGTDPVYILHIFCKKDTANQGMTLIKNEPPEYGGNMRLIEIQADDLEHDKGDHDYHVFLEIKPEDRKEYEDMVFVRIDHIDTPHGDGGSIHYPPGGEGG